MSFFPHLSQNSESEPLDSKTDVRTMNYTTKKKIIKKEGTKEQKNDKKFYGYIAFG